MTDAAWEKILEDFVVDSIVFCARGDLSDEELAKYKQRGWEQEGKNWTRTIEREESNHA